MLSSTDGKMIILSSPSGAGKTTLVKKISKEKNFKVSIVDIEEFKSTCNQETISGLLAILKDLEI